MPRHIADTDTPERLLPGALERSLALLDAGSTADTTMAALADAADYARRAGHAAAACLLTDALGLVLAGALHDAHAAALGARRMLQPTDLPQVRIARPDGVRSVLRCRPQRTGP